jgi:hypothetical protein
MIASPDEGVVASEAYLDPRCIAIRAYVGYLRDREERMVHDLTHRDAEERER